MKNNKGFTLIELLAVIVILAIIALIATPMVLKIIDDARISTAKEQTKSFVYAVNTHILTKQLTDEGVLPANGTNDTGVALKFGEHGALVEDTGAGVDTTVQGKWKNYATGIDNIKVGTTLTVKNYKVESGTVKLNTGGTVLTCTYANTGDVTCNK